ncbi:MAG: protein kinase [Polyangiaceae bacterium]|nr:protein kinase [Polyangiaceae bacterium]
MSERPTDDPSRLQRFKLLRRLARDAVATTWIARAADQPRETVELVQVEPAVAADEVLRTAFLAEAAALAEVPHPGVVGFVATGYELGVLYGVRPHVSAIALADLFEALGNAGQKLDGAVAARLGIELATALRSLHAAPGRPLVHGDLTPHHVLLASDGSVSLLHSGLALAAARPGIGPSCNERLAYKAPEQIGAPGALDPRVDVFACAAVLYEALVGERLFGGETDAEIVGELRQARVLRLTELRQVVPAALGSTVLRALSREPAARFRHAGELCDALRAVPGVAPVVELARLVRRYTAHAAELRRAQLAEAMAGGPASSRTPRGAPPRATGSGQDAPSTAPRRETGEWYGGQRSPAPAPSEARRGEGPVTPSVGERIRRLGSDIGFAEQQPEPPPTELEDGADEPAQQRGNLRPGMIVAGKFALVRLIAEGGIGAVFEAEDTLIGRRVALKVLRPQYARHADLVRRFRREAHATAQVEHANVVSIFEMGRRTDGTFFMAQELLRGPNLAEHLYERKRLPLAEALAVLLPIMGALVAAHARGIIHRDLKPSNIVLARTSSGEIVPKLIDFGAARVRARRRGETHIGTLVGTPHYMSPEQALGESGVDGRSDVWSMAVVLFELLTGRCPFDGPNEHAILARITTEVPPRLEAALPDAPPALCEVVAAAMTMDPNERLDMAALRGRLAAFGGSTTATILLAEPLRAAMPPPPGAPRSPARGGEIARELEDDEDSLPLGVDEDEGTGAGGTDWMRATAAADTDYAEEAAPARAVDRAVQEAQQALSVNALEDAILHADTAIAAGRGDADLVGRMRLVQAIASRWLGKYADTETYAVAATRHLARGSTGWYAALGHVAIARGYQGHADELGQVVDELRALETTGTVSAAHVIAACRLAVFLVRAGSPDVAEDVVANAHRLVDRQEVAQPVVHAWLDVALAEFAVHEGDPTTYLRRVESAAERFTSAGDVRNACLQRANVGNAYMHFGAWDHAVVVLREALALAEPMKLDSVGTMQANLGYALCRLGAVDSGLEVEVYALEQTLRIANRRLECFARVYLAFIRWARGELDLAAEELRIAIERSLGLPSLRAYALAALAATFLAEGRTAEARPPAEEAMALFERLGGAEEGESLIRVVDAEVVHASGRVAEACRRIEVAKKRLLERAERISESRWRHSFLHNVPENAKILELAAAWLGEGGAVASG